MLEEDLYPELTPEREAAEFERLKPLLAEHWSSMALTEEKQYTSVVVPSISLDPGELRKIDGVAFYEERLLFMLIRLRNPRARLVYVTSQPIHPLALEYYFQLLAGIPASHARSRLTLLCTYDASPRPLTEKILERPRLVERIRAGIPDPTAAHLTVFNSTPLERKLAVLLGIPLDGCDPSLVHLGTKSGGRKVFREAGVPLPLGFEEIYTRRDMAEALLEVRRRRPGLRRSVVKLNESFAGEGNGLFRYPAEESVKAVEDAIPLLEFPVPDETAGTFLEKTSRMGCVVEEFLEGEDKRSPSSQYRIDPQGRVSPVSTHEQILGGPGSLLFLGARFPAEEPYRLAIQEAGLKVGEVLSSKGVLGRFGVDFVVRKRPDGEWEHFAVEINLRKGGTTHPFLALQFLTLGQIEAGTGLFLSSTGHPKYYRATDSLRSPRYRGLLPEDLVEILTANGLHYSPVTETGVLFHMIGALSQYGKLGLTAIGSSREEAETLYEETLSILDREALLRRSLR
ncbi:carboxylate-amine ligase [Acidobacteria bacterium ACD]|nr:MAG: carboxylate-amine ligase [Acidobacteriota bacterium]MCE7957412.1 carboxylate-amine ligase [Acidobacteria bacterium ACB2]MDL1949741.1 carboxylate-amine ligase [Acidobacteria bacterium ACD]